jgi:hypothetical protein
MTPNFHAQVEHSEANLGNHPNHDITSKESLFMVFGLLPSSILNEDKYGSRKSFKLRDHIPMLCPWNHSIHLWKCLSLHQALSILEFFLILVLKPFVVHKGATNKDLWTSPLLFHQMYYSNRRVVKEQC